ncbi:MAG: BatA domain-containing protein, partial [Verrucomicrobiota bacterium]
MSFLQPALLLGLPLALLPIIIHLINRHRHRTVEWAAMMFLQQARKINKGMARLRQILILAMRVAAVLFIVFAASRPLSGGVLALTGGKADTIILLLDRSASMEEQILETGESKRSAALSKLAELIEKTGKGSEIVLIDSATLTPTVISRAEALNDLPQTWPTDTTADIPNLLQAAADYLANSESGRADVWLASDQRQADWQPGSGRWQSLRSDFSSAESVRLFLLTYPEIQPDNLNISVANVKRQRTSEGLQLVLDLAVRRNPIGEEAADLPLNLEFTVNGTRTTQPMTLSGDEMIRLGHTISLGNSDQRGWGRIDLPADSNLRDNTAYFVFDDPAARKTVILSDDDSTIDAITAAAGTPVENAAYEAVTLSSDQVAQIPWSETALLFWQAPTPTPNSATGRLLK